MNTELKAKWVEALRSGKYQQAKFELKDGDAFCCLGVLCALQGADFDDIQSRFGTLSLSENPSEFLGFLGGRSSELSQMNDNGNSFAQIADRIEAIL